jgi:predicted kinase
VVFARILRRNVSESRAQVPWALSARLHGAVADRLARLLRERRATMRRRAREGRLVEGHGDLRAEHFVRRSGEGAPWDVVDAIEFSTALRCVDPLSDMAFLSMDLRAHGRHDLADAFEAAYLGPEPDPDAPALLPLFLAHRAHVRAGVDALRSRDDTIPEPLRERAAASARRHLALSWALSRRGETPPLVVMAGPAGVGKSVVASAVASLLGAEVLRSDVIRKRLAGLAPTDRPTPEQEEALYSGTLSSRTYLELLRGAERRLRAGRAVVLDATYLRRGARDAPALLARRIGAPYAYLAVDVPPEEARARIERRAASGRDPSDATVAVYESQVGTIEPFDAVEEPRVALWDGRADPADAFPAVVEALAR